MAVLFQATRSSSFQIFSKVLGNNFSEEDVIGYSDRYIQRPMKIQKRYEEPKPQRKTIRNSEAVRRPPAEKTEKTEPVKPGKPVLSEELQKRLSSLLPKEPLQDYHQLNDLFSNTVESELTQIMQKIKEDLPVAADTDAEKMVLDKIKMIADVDIKHVLGLNITKRLLNVYNPLYVKIEFDRRPPVNKFVQWMNCGTLKYFPHPHGRHTFIAKPKTIEDFDRVVSKKAVRIDGIKAKITPHYRFSSCPLTLKTKYKVKRPETKDDNEHKEKNKEVKSKDKTGKIVSASSNKAAVLKKTGSAKVTSKPTSTTTSITAKDKSNAQEIPNPKKKLQENTTANVKTDDKTITQKKPTPTNEIEEKPTVNVAKTANKNVSQNIQAKKEPKKHDETTIAPAKVSTENKPVQKTVEIPINKVDKIENKPTNSKTVSPNDKKQSTENKPTIGKIIQAPKTDPPIGKTVTPSDKKVGIINQPTVSKIDQTPKKNEDKHTVSKTIALSGKKEITENKPTVSKAVAPNDKKESIVNKPKFAKTVQISSDKKVTTESATPKQTQSKLANKRKIQQITPNKPDKRQKKSNNDFDELDDEDILALMSNAIVLDECIGSDED